MIPLPNLDSIYLTGVLRELLITPSPTGHTGAVISLLESILGEFHEVALARTKKGSLLATYPGRNSEAPRTVATHVDTLGAMVKEIKPNGRLRMTQLGGFAWASVEGEGCTVILGNSETLSGSIIPAKSSAHVHGELVKNTVRDDALMEVRLDARTESEAETRALGVEVGDYIAFDPRPEVVNGFFRSRHLDNKASAACAVTAIRAMSVAGLAPVQKTYFLFSNYEEVGHGAAADIPEDTAELVVVDMAAVGEGQNSDEFHATVCVKDSSGPYDEALSRRLRSLAEARSLPYKIDIYPNYASDGSAYWRAGGKAPVALIGPGVDASHHYERTHTDALLATTRWILAYLLEEGEPGQPG
ncbi:MAG TPA: M42 family metallopeptidase [Anaerolineales bacterium]|nr:M42 family metallopeptidase [Anaerolineales bacterium]